MKRLVCSLLVVTLPFGSILADAPKEKNAIGTGIGTLIPTMPACTPCVNRRAAPPLSVKMAVPLPNSCWLISASAASRSGTRTMASTGPKISSW